MCVHNLLEVTFYPNNESPCRRHQQVRRDCHSCKNMHFYYNIRCSISTITCFLVSTQLIKNRDVNMHTGLNENPGDVLHKICRALQINDAGVDPHLKFVKCVGTIPAWGLPCHNLQFLRGEPHWPKNLLIELEHISTGNLTQLRGHASVLPRPMRILHHSLL